MIIIFAYVVYQVFQPVRKHCALIFDLSNQQNEKPLRGFYSNKKK